MKNVLVLSVSVLLSALLYSCDKDGDNCYEIGDHSELAIDLDITEDQVQKTLAK
ncbi:hypothetical protein [Poritiphilus flavus]|uniref:hypothetical protein n=1 Tax=Poritiphilus flavus TaxID=2697053 RepID=UPI0013729B56|nr:hypothetical protein [Poritiphilus flavus]